MAKKRFFSFVLGTAAVAAGVYLVQKKGGIHVSFDIDAPELGESAAEWKKKHDGEEAAELADEKSAD